MTEGVIEKAVAYVKDMFTGSSVDTEGNPLPAKSLFAGELVPGDFTFKSVAEVDAETRKTGSDLDLERLRREVGE